VRVSVCSINSSPLYPKGDLPGGPNHSNTSLIILRHPGRCSSAGFGFLDEGAICRNTTASASTVALGDVISDRYV
jgi:hypothetical protein